MPDKKSVPLEKQLEDLASCGINLNPGITIDYLLKSYGREDFEKDPYTLLLYTIGSPMTSRYDGVEKLYSNNVFHYDPECIEETGDYAYIAHRLSILAGDTLPLKDIKDKIYFFMIFHFTVLSFRIDSKKYKWFLFGREDWVDARIYAKFARLQYKRIKKKRFKEPKRFTFYTYGDFSDFIIGCNTPAQLSRLKKLTHLDFTWLHESH